ncbi:aspartate aminotransferase, partial [bacterium]
MNYSEFRELRQDLLLKCPELVDMAETNHVRALAPCLAAVEIAEDAPKAHRCHLAEDWLDLFDFPADDKNRLCISRGVRHSLELIFPVLAQNGYLLHLPTDVYPVYEALAASAGIERQAFPTLPEFQLPGSPKNGPEVLLLPNPLKPVGRYLSNGEVADIKDWLARDERRRLIIDGVYTFDTHFHGSTLDLLSTGQTILLHSLSKGWVSPL